ncbi:unnamed protein product, partial [Mesorhabditis belari]|uniref:Uncharacterized protein n=1 Tax=Mesorhabditis belari TaxID=2138241 RepID=A0AAF3FGN0_9BILA
MSACTCLRDIYASCITNPLPKEEFWWANDPEMGRMVYTCAMLLLFSAIIVLLMFRSIKRSSSAIEMEALLDAMRFREELDIQQRQRRRLLKAKTKVAAWLTKAQNGEPRGWRTTPQLLPPRKPTVSSSNSEIPEIVVTDEMPIDFYRSKTPALSLLYDFENSPNYNSSRSGSLSMPRGSVCSSIGSHFSLNVESSPSSRKQSTTSIQRRKSSVRGSRGDAGSRGSSASLIKSGGKCGSMSLDHDGPVPRMSFCSNTMNMNSSSSTTSSYSHILSLPPYLYSPQKAMNDCPSLLDPRGQCYGELRSLMKQVNYHIWSQHKNSHAALVGADIYTVVMLSIFASVIVVLMVRAIKPTETLDDQVTFMLTSMRVRVENEENARQKRKLREAKKSAQRWLTELKSRSIRRLSYRRSTSGSEDRSMHSAPIAGIGSISLKGRFPRARSYNGFLPEIVVTEEVHQDSLENSSPFLSRQSSMGTYDGVSQFSFDSDREVFDENERNHHNTPNPTLIV